MKKWYTSKTIWAGISTIVAGAGMYFTGEQGVEELLISLIGAVFTILRVVTKKEIR